MTFTHPKWALELIRFISVKPQFIFWGNIYDIYPRTDGSQIITSNLIDYLESLLSQHGYDAVLSYEPVYGFSLIGGSGEKVKEITDISFTENQNYLCTLTQAAAIIQKIVLSKEGNITVILNFGSRYADIAKQEYEEFYYRLFRLCHLANPVFDQKMGYIKYNTIVWILDKANDIPAWYTVDNSKIRVLPLLKPDNIERRIIIENLAKTIPGYESLNVVRRDECLSIFVDQTHNLHANEIISIVALAKRESVPFSDIAEAIRRYKIGVIENPWSKIEREKIEKAEELLGRRVKGQNQAIQKASDIIKRSLFGLSGAQYSKYSNRPKGVLFFAGPTGVGKTELAKAITELLFGSDTSYIRFDMSEFKQEHADQRLLGSPPGYIGYDVGGELTNAVKQNPFSVLLFDEIEKAHPRIFDIFLQILDDGRITSGQGETVYFSESLIIFTSNLGVYEVNDKNEKIQKVHPDMPFDAIGNTIKNSINDFFIWRLGRPEILNRIGENVVVLDFIRKEVADQIFEKMMNNIIEKLQDTHQITILVTKKAREKLNELACADLSMGGRGIGNKLEELFINPLARELFLLNAHPGKSYILEDLEETPMGWKMKIKAGVN